MQNTDLGQIFSNEDTTLTMHCAYHPTPQTHTHFFENPKKINKSSNYINILLPLTFNRFIVVLVSFDVYATVNVGR